MPIFTPRSIHKNLLMPTPMRLAIYLLWAASWAGVLLVGARVHAQAPMQSAHYAINEGLSDRLITKILLNRHGFVWIGTENGLNKFDGYDFITFNNDPAQIPTRRISATNINTMAEGPNGDIFIVYNNQTGFFDILSPQTHQVQQVAIRPQDGITGLPRLVQLGSLGEVFIPTYDERLRLSIFQYTPYSKPLFTALLRDSEPYQKSVPVQIYALADQRFFVNDEEKGLRLFDKNGVLLKHFEAPDFAGFAPGSGYPATVNFLHQHSRGQIWLGMGGMPGAYNLNEHTLRFEAARAPLHQGMFKSIWEDQQGNLLLGAGSTERRYPKMESLYCVQASGGVLDFSHLLSAGYYVTDLAAVDFFKTIFMGLDIGLKIVQNTSTKVKQFLSKNLSADRRGLIARGITGDERGMVYFASEENYWFSIDTRTDVLDTLPLLDARKGARIDFACGTNLYYVEGGTLWGSACDGNSGMLIRYDVEKCVAQTYHYPSKFNGFALGQGGLFWIIAEPTKGKGELLSFDPATEVFTPFADHKGQNPLQGVVPRVIQQSRAGLLWVGTQDGLYTIDPAQKTTQVRMANGTHVVTLYEAADGALWLGTYNGLHIWPKDGIAPQSYTPVEGLVSNVVCGILPDKQGKYWLSTFNGLSFFDPENKTNPFRNFYEADGFSHDEFNRLSYYCDPLGYCYLGGVNGLNVFHPDDLLINKRIPPVVLARITWYNSKLDSTVVMEADLHKLRTLVLGPYDNNVRLRFILPIYGQPGKNQLKYRLDTGDKAWTYELKSPDIALNTPRAGNYQLEVKGADANGNWSDETYLLNIYVRQVWYKTYWFVTLFLLSISGLAYAFLRWQNSQKIRTEQLRIKISSDLHDELSGLLSAIAMQSEMLEDFVASETGRTRLQKMGEVSRSAMTKMSDVIWSIDARKDKMAELVIRMEEYADALLLPLGIKYQIHLDKTDLKQTVPVEVRQDLYLIYKEAINNIVRHAQASHVDITLRQRQPFFEMIVQDNGVVHDGPASAKFASPHPGQGMANISMRAKRLRARLDIDRENGFAIKVRLPRFNKQ